MTLQLSQKFGPFFNINFELVYFALLCTYLIRFLFVDNPQ